MKFKSEVMTQASGSIGGVTYAHNSAGMYRRARSIPTNPNTNPQQSVRMTMAELSTAWATLTNAQREGWAAWASANPITGVFGDPLTLSGQQMYIRLNAARMVSSTVASITALARVDDPPLTGGMATFTPFVFTGVSGSQASVSLAYDNTDAWANEDEGALLAYSGLVVSGGRTFYKGPYQFTARADGDGVTPPTSPLSVSNIFFAGGDPGEKMAIRARVVRADGRISAWQSAVVTLA